jgi:hypothetical protein
MNQAKRPGKGELVEAVAGLGGGGAIFAEGINIISERPNIMMLPSGIAIAMLGGFAVLAADYFRRLEDQDRS